MRKIFFIRSCYLDNLGAVSVWIVLACRFTNHAKLVNLYETTTTMMTTQQRNNHECVSEKVLLYKLPFFYGRTLVWRKLICPPGGDS